jgi:hypothetical protein
MNFMKHYMLALSGLVLMLSAVTARGMDYGDANVQPVNFSGWFAGDEPAGHHGRNCHGKGCADGAACGDCNGFTPICSTCEPLWNAYIGAVILDRSNPSGVDNFEYDWQGGVDVDVRRRVLDDYQLQVRYFGVDQWSEVANTTNFGQVTANSNLHSTEVNLRRQWTESLTLLGGFRWIEMSDFARDGLDNTVDTNNHMYGAQLGAEWLVWDRGGPFTITTGVKAGIYYNRADYDANFGPVQQSRRSLTAFAGEWDILSRYQVTDRMAIRAGYQLLWLEGVASFDAPQVAAVNNADRVNTAGSPFYHGAVIGAEFNF